VSFRRRSIDVPRTDRDVMEVPMATPASLFPQRFPRDVHFAPGVHASAADLALLALDDAGTIKDCSAASAALFGHLPDALIGRPVSLVLPQLGDDALVLDGRVHPRLAYLCRCAMAFQARREDDSVFPVELFINRLDRHHVVVLARSLVDVERDGVPARGAAASWYRMPD
jgi:PAS domain-containing protein